MTAKGEGLELDAEEEVPDSPGVPDVVAEAVTAVATGIPPQMQRNFFKAFGRVFLAGAEWPAKALEGRARAAAARANVEVARHDAEASDIKARQKAREVIYRDSAKAAASLFKDPEQALRALDFRAADVMRDQAVREDVVLIAADEIKNQPPQNDSTNEIDDDWLYSFFKEASKRTKVEYKILFGRILAGEIKAPGSFSIGTVEALARLNKHTADIFQRACNISTLSFGSARLISEGFAEAGNNGLEVYGLSYNDLARLMEEGLLRSEFTEYNMIPDALLRQGLVVDHGGSQFYITRPSLPEGSQNNSDLKLTGASLTVAGAELRSVVTMTPHMDYLRALATWLATQQIDVYGNLETLGTQLRGEKVPTNIT